MNTRRIRMRFFPFLIFALLAGTLTIGPATDVLAQERTRRRVPTRPALTQPAATATPAPTGAQPASTPIPALSEVRIGDSRLRAVIGDRLSPVIYALTAEHDLFRSNDEGTTWSLMARDTDVDHFVMSPANPMVLYSGTGLTCGEADAVTQPFFRSANGGVTWTRLPLGDNLVPLLAHPQDADMLLAADCHMPYLTRDGGQQWQPRPDLSPNDLWGQYRATQIVASGQVRDLPADAANWHYLYAAGVDSNDAGMVAYSGDIGDNWERITPRTNPKPAGALVMTADPYTAGRLWFADGQGIWYTEDFGLSWEMSRAGIEDTLARHGAMGVTALAPGPDDTLFVGTVDGIYQRDGAAGDLKPVDGISYPTLAVESLLMPGQSNVLWINTTDGVYQSTQP